jgi:hypothetical protein
MEVAPTFFWLICTHVFGGITVLCLILVGKDFSAPNSYYGEAGILYGPQVAEIVVAMFAILATPLAACAAVLTSSPLMSRSIRALIPAYICCASAVAAFTAMILSIEPFRTYNILYADQPDNVQQLLGGIIFALSLPLAAATAFIAVSRLTSFGSNKHLRAAPIHPAEFSKNAGLIAGGLAALGVGLTLTCILSSVMNYGPGSYLMATTPYSLLQNVKVGGIC